MSEIIRKVAKKYDLVPEILEGGRYPKDQIRILMALMNKWMSEPSDRNFELYVEQKAKFIVKNLKKGLRIY